MTLQQGEIIFYKGKIYCTQTLPLNPYLKRLKIRPFFKARCTSCWRGYTGSWKIKDSKLYLVGLVFYAEGPERKGIENIFPGQKTVFADWFTGEIMIHEGKLLNVFNMGYLRVYEKDVYLKFEKGVLTDKRTVVNGHWNN